MGIVFAAFEALWGRASSAINCLIAAVLTQGFGSLSRDSQPKLLFVAHNFRKNASSTFGLVGAHE